MTSHLLRYVLLAGLTLHAAPQMTAQAVSTQGPAILLIVPESDTTMTGSPVYRLSGSTAPGSSMTLNGKLLKVYPSGAVAGLLNLEVGPNIFTLSATDRAGQSSEKSFVIIRRKPLESLRPDSLAIEDVMMEPAQDLWLNNGDLLKVQCKGTPGCRVTFLGNVPMYEAAPEQAGGLRGVYRGTYSVGAEDSLCGQAVRIVMCDPGGRTLEKETKGKVWCMSRELPRIGITRGTRPCLGFGLGEDRLGGAVFSVLNPGIRLMITGKMGSQYRVALTPEREAWIEERSVDLQPPGAFPPYSLTGSWNVYGDEKYDYVTLELSDRLPYSSFQESSPARINVDIYGAVSNSNWITQHLSTREIKNVYYTQVSRNVFRMTVELNHKQLWGYGIDYRGNALVLRIRRQPEKLKIKALTFVLDAGHGGENEGAIGSTGAREKDINLSTVRHVKELLEDRGARVILTRAEDVFVRMDERVKKAIDSGADMLISIHSNSIGNTSNPELVKGVSTYYKHICYRPLSLCLYNSVLKANLVPFGNVGSFNFSLNSPTELPNALVELAFMSNPEDEIMLLDDGFRKNVAKRIVDGIDDFLDECDE